MYSRGTEVLVDKIYMGTPYKIRNTQITTLKLDHTDLKNGLEILELSELHLGIISNCPWRVGIFCPILSGGLGR
jgi:hypothetical protein